MSEVLGESFPKQQARVREILGCYKEIGEPGRFGAVMIEQLLQRADRAVIRGDLVEMIAVYQELKEVE